MRGGVEMPERRQALETVNRRCYSRRHITHCSGRTSPTCGCGCGCGCCGDDGGDFGGGGVDGWWRC